MFCPHCGEEISTEWKYCLKCGQSIISDISFSKSSKRNPPRQTDASPLKQKKEFVTVDALPAEDAAPVTCPRCGTENPAGSNFCGSCNARISDRSVAPPVPVSSSDYLRPMREFIAEALSRLNLRIVVIATVGLIALAGIIVVVPRLYRYLTTTMFTALLEKGDVRLEHPFSHSLVFSGNEKAYAYVAGEDGREYIVYVGDDKTVVGDKYGKIRSLVLSGNGKHYAFVAGVGGGLNSNGDYVEKKRIVVIDGKRGDEYDSVDRHSLRLSADGTNYMYTAIYGCTRLSIGYYSGGKTFVIKDGTKSEEYDYIGNISMSTDGKHYTYQAGRGGKWTADGSYIEGKWFVVKDGTKSEEYDYIGNISMSTDGKHYVHEAGRGVKWTTDGKPYDGKWFVIKDGTKGEEYDYTANLSMSTDGTHYVYSAGRGGKWLTNGTYVEGKQFVVKDGTKGDEYDYTSDLSMSTDGKHYVYEAGRGVKWLPSGIPYDGKWLVVKDGTKGEEFDYTGSLSMSTDGRHYIYHAGSLIRWLADGSYEFDYDAKPFTVIIDGKKLGPYHKFKDLKLDEMSFTCAVQKQNMDSPWETITEKYTSGNVSDTIYSKNKKYRAFVEVRGKDHFLVVKKEDGNEK